jgi:hypothetical protein
MGKSPPTVADLLGLDNIEGIVRRPEGDALFYLFRLDGLLPGEQMLAVDVIGGLTRVCTAGSVSTIVAEAQVNEVKTRLLIALAQSHPYAVARYQMLALSNGWGIVEAKEELEKARQEQVYESVMQPLRDVVAACNVKLVPLGLAINAINHETEYQFNALSCAGGCADCPSEISYN